MSLTSFLSKKEVKSLFRQTFEFKPANVEAPLKAPPLTTNHAAVGNAFDYLARFWLERRHGVAESHRWIAEQAAIGLSVQSGEYVAADIGGERRLIPAKEWESRWSENWPDGCSGVSRSGPDPTVSKAAAVARSIIGAAKDNVAAYAKSGVAGDDLFRSALMLGRLDVVLRTGRADYSSAPANDDDIKDLRNLWNVLEDGDLRRVKGPVWLNPTFGRASGMVGGADADFIADDTLVDVKTTKGGRFTRVYFDQLAGYCVLDYLGQKRGMQDMQGHASLKRTGIYFSRHGALVTVDTERVYNASGFDNFINEFCALAEKRHSFATREAPVSNPAVSEPATPHDSSRTRRIESGTMRFPTCPKCNQPIRKRTIKYHRGIVVDGTWVCQNCSE